MTYIVDVMLMEIVLHGIGISHTQRPNNWWDLFRLEEDIGVLDPCRTPGPVMLLSVVASWKRNIWNQISLQSEKDLKTITSVNITHT